MAPGQSALPKLNHEKQGKTKDLSRLEETKETRQLNAMWGPGLDLEWEKDTGGKTGEIRTKSVV